MSLLQIIDQGFPFAQQLATEWLIPVRLGLAKLLEQDLKLYSDGGCKPQRVVKASNKADYVSLSGFQVGSQSCKVIKVKENLIRGNVPAYPKDLLLARLDSLHGSKCVLSIGFIQVDNSLWVAGFCIHHPFSLVNLFL